MTAPPPAPDPGALDPAYLPFLAAIGPTVPPVVPGEASIAEVRAAAARARAAWQAGGAAMHAVRDETVETPHGPVPIRLYYPQAARPLPTLIYLHGGGWTLLDLDTHDRMMREWAAASGWAVVGIDYPRAPEVRFPDTVSICTAAVEAVRHEAPRLGLAAPRALAGDSSGANLALAAALAARDAGHRSADALILLYGVYDGTREYASHQAFSRPPLTLTRDRLAWFWDQYCPDPAERAHPLASPVHADLAGLPPVRLVTTGIDILRDENLALLVRLFAAGNAVSLDHHPNAPHAFLEALALHGEAMAAIARSASWLRATTGA